MDNKNMNKLDLIFIIGIIVISIIGIVADMIYWRGVDYGGFPVFSCISIFVSYALWFVLLIYSFFKTDINKPQYVRWYMIFVLPFLYISIILLLLIIVAIFINIFEFINK